MTSGKKPGYGWLLALTIVFTLAALSTLMPVPYVAAPNMIGYRSHCPAAPVSTLLCLVMSAVTCRVRARKFVR